MVHFKSLEMWTISTAAPLMNGGEGMWLLLLKSTTSSFVFPTLMQRLFSPHRSTRSFTSCRYNDSSLWDISPTTAVSSANFTIRLPGCLAEQSYVNSVYSRGLRTHPWVMGEDEMPWIFTVCGQCVKKSRSHLQREGVNLRSSSLLARVYGMICVRCRVVLPVGVLEWLYIDVNVVPYVDHEEPLQAFHDYQGQSHRAIVIHAFCCCTFGHRDDGGSLKTHWHHSPSPFPGYRLGLLLSGGLMRCRVLLTSTADTLRGKLTWWNSEPGAGGGVGGFKAGIEYVKGHLGETGPRGIQYLSCCSQ